MDGAELRYWSGSNYSSSTFIDTFTNSSDSEGSIATTQVVTDKKQPTVQKLSLPKHVCSSKPGPYSKEMLYKNSYHPAQSSHTAAAAVSGGTVAVKPLTRRIVSASRTKINQLQNEVTELSCKLYTLQQENQQLEIEKRRRIRVLEQYEQELPVTGGGDTKFVVTTLNEEQKSEAAAMFEQQKEEIRVLRETLFKNRNACSDVEKRLMMMMKELDETRQQMREMKLLVDDTTLPERDQLEYKLNRAGQQLQQSNNEIKVLQAEITENEREHKLQMKNTLIESRQTQNSIDRLTKEKQTLLMKLRERNKELEIQNIYCNQRKKLNDSMSAIILMNNTRRLQLPPINKCKSSDDAYLQAHSAQMEAEGRNIGPQQRYLKQIRVKTNDDERFVRRSRALEESSDSRHNEDLMRSISLEDNAEEDADVRMNTGKCTQLGFEARARDEFELRVRGEAEKDRRISNYLKCEELRHRQGDSSEETGRNREGPGASPGLKVCERIEGNTALLKNRPKVSRRIETVERAQPVEDKDLPQFGNYKPTFVGKGKLKARRYIDAAEISNVIGVCGGQASTDGINLKQSHVIDKVPEKNSDKPGA